MSGTRLNVVAVGLATLTSALLLVVPTGSSVSVTVAVTTEAPRPNTGDAPASTTKRVERYERTTLLESDGYGVLAPLAFPIAVLGLPLAVRRTKLARPARVVAAALLAAFVAVASLSIGVFYAPALVAIVVAVALRD